MFTFNIYVSNKEFIFPKKIRFLLQVMQIVWRLKIVRTIWCFKNKFGTPFHSMINVNLRTVDITQNTMGDIKVPHHFDLWILIADHTYRLPRKKNNHRHFDIYIGQIIRDYTHCSQLYCWDDLTLLLKTLPGAPALSGTRCDMGRICYMGRCIDENSIGPTERPTKNPSTVPGVIQNVCDSINNFVTSIINIFG